MFLKKCTYLCFFVIGFVYSSQSRSRSFDSLRAVSQSSILRIRSGVSSVSDLDAKGVSRRGSPAVQDSLVVPQTSSSKMYSKNLSNPSSSSGCSPEGDGFSNGPFPDRKGMGQSDIFSSLATRQPNDLVPEVPPKTLKDRQISGDDWDPWRKFIDEIESLQPNIRQNFRTNGDYYIDEFENDPRIAFSRSFKFLDPPNLFFFERDRETSKED